MRDSKAEPVLRIVDADHPWLGLSPFTSATKEYFFGRDQEIRDLFLRVREQPLTILYGQSGLGKTSLLGAGLIPKLQVEGFAPYTIRLSYEANDPSLVDQTLAGLKVLRTSEAMQADFNTSKTLWEFFHYLPGLPEQLASQPPVLIFDQFEEIFTLGESNSRQRQVHEFFTQLADLIENRPPAEVQQRLLQNRRLALQYDLGPSSARVVLALREDYLSRLEDWKKTMPSLMRNRVGIYQLNGPQALEAVVRAGGREGRNLVSDEVGTNIVRFVAKRDADTPLSEIAAVPPILSLLCDELNQARLANHQSQITAELVSAQSADILQNFYNRAFDGLPPQVRRLVEDRMVTVGGHRNPVAREDVVSELSRQGVADPQAALDQLILGRLLSSEERGGIQRVEITHDVLGPLVVHSRDDRRAREQIEQAERQREEAAQQRRRFQRIAAIMIALTTIAIIGSVVAIAASIKARDQELLATKQTGIANEKTKEAERQTEIANEQKIEAQKQTELAKRAKNETERLLVEQVEQTKTASKVVFEFGVAEYEAGHMQSATEKLRQAWSMRSDDDLLKNSYAKILVDRLTRGGRSFIVLPRADNVSMAICPDNLRMATASREGEVCIWNINNGAMIGSPISIRMYVWSLAFSPDGHYLAVGCENGLLVWDTETRDLVSASMEDEHATSHIAFSPDGKRIASDGAQYTVNIRDVATGKPLVAPLRNAESLGSIAFSPDGKRLASVSHEKSARIWDVATGDLIAEMQHDATVSEACFSPDGKRLATCSSDKMARVWDALSGALIAKTAEHESDVLELDFNPNGTCVATATIDGKARLWNSSTGELIGKAMEHAATIESMNFSPDGTRLATAARDNSARIWDASSGEPLSMPMKHDNFVDEAIFSPDGTRVITSSWDESVRIWDALAGIAQGVHEHPHADVSTVIIPDANQIVTVSAKHGGKLWSFKTDELIDSASYQDVAAVSPDGTCYVKQVGNVITLCNIATGESIGQPLAQNNIFDSAVFSRDSSRLVTISELVGQGGSILESEVLVWDAKTALPVGGTLSCRSWVNVIFSPDAKRLATYSRDDIVRVWDISTGSQICESRKHGDSISAIDFSPDGASMVTASLDKTARVWNSSTGELLGPVLSESEGLTAVAFSPNGTHIGTGSVGGATQLWDAKTHERVGLPIKHGYVLPADILFGPDGNMLSFCADHTIHISEAYTGATLGVSLNENDEVRCYAFSREGNRLVIGTEVGLGFLEFPSYPSDLKKFIEVMSAIESGKVEHDASFDGWLEDHTKQMTFKNRHTIAVQAYAKEDWFAAAFHLRWLCQQKPDNQRWLKMLEEAEKHLQEKAAPKAAETQ